MQPRARSPAESCAPRNLIIGPTTSQDSCVGNRVFDLDVTRQIIMRKQLMARQNYEAFSDQIVG